MNLIKWPGGKSGEIKFINNMIPEYDRYIEPFFGGGAVFFSLRPEKAVINDISKDLINFIEIVKNRDPEFLKLLKKYIYIWDMILKILDSKNFYLSLIHRSQKKIDSNSEIIKEIRIRLKEKTIEGFDSEKCLDYIIKYANLKILRIEFNEKKRNIKLNETDILENIKTGFMAGIYSYYRMVYNKIIANKWDKNNNHIRAVYFYLIREYCFSSMFRYNKKGEFNIPYGGRSYNRKNIFLKINYFFDKKSYNYFSNTKIKCLDFEIFLKQLNFDKRDFIFLDPPYDSRFNDYEGKNFSNSDQIRLMKFLTTTKAKFIMIIKKTSFILGLYKNIKKIYIEEFDKNYTYNVRGRNSRKANHLIIYNFKKNV